MVFVAHFGIIPCPTLTACKLVSLPVNVMELAKVTAFSSLNRHEASLKKVIQQKAADNAVAQK